MLNEVEIFSLTQDTVVLAIAGDVEGAADALARLGQGTDTKGMYGVCCGYAEIAKQALLRLGADLSTPLALETLRPDAVEQDPAKAFAVRFVTAYANGDNDMTVALYKTTLDHEERHQEAVVSLLATATGMWNRATLETRRTL